MFLLRNKEKYRRVIPVTPFYAKHCNYVGLVILYELNKQVNLFQCLVRLDERYKFSQANSETLNFV